MSLRSILDQASRTGRAVGAFTCYELRAFEAVAREAERFAAPAVVLISRGQLEDQDGRRFVRAVAAAKSEVRAPLVLQADHLQTIESAARAIELGCDAIMFDGSRLPLEANAEQTRTVVQEAHRQGVAVEAELGRVEGSEDAAGVTLSGAPTDPREVGLFLDQTGVDSLAVAIGNVHGHYHGEPALDWERLTAVRQAAGTVPLALHGASGLPDHVVAHARSEGVAKLNVNTELRAAYFEAVATGLERHRDALNVHALGEDATQRMQEVVADKLALLGWDAADSEDQAEVD